MILKYFRPLFCATLASVDSRAIATFLFSPAAASRYDGSIAYFSSIKASALGCKLKLSEPDVSG